MFLGTRRSVSATWSKFTNPQNFQSAFIVSIMFLRVAGMFPYALVDGNFRISCVDLAISIMHITVYAIVNIHMMYVDSHTYAKPLIVEGEFAVAGNIVLKALGILLTFAIFFPILMGAHQFVRLLNGYNTLMLNLGELGIKANQLLKKILVVSGLATLVVFAMCLFIAIQSIYFYEKLTNEEASIQFFYVVVLSNYYKSMCLYSLGSYLCTSYLVVVLMNRFLEDVLKNEMERDGARKNRVGYVGLK